LPRDWTMLPEYVIYSETGMTLKGRQNESAT